MIYYSVPSDFKNKTIDGYVRLHERYPNHRVIETYGQITIDSKFSSGRYLSELPQVSMENLGAYVAYCNQYGIAFNYTLNSSFMNNIEFTNQGISDIQRFIDILYNMGIRCFTVALPTVYEIIRSMGLNINIKASTICQINNANKAETYKRNGFDRIVVDESINRDFATLKRIVKCFGNGVEVIANSMCNKNCVNRMFHYNQTSADAYGKPGVTYYAPKCTLDLFKDPNRIMQLSWIRPEDISYYKNIGIYNYKLQGREYALNGDPVKAVETYFQENYDGNLMELLDLFSTNFKYKFYVDNKKLDDFIKPFTEPTLFCHNNCNDCGYCKGFAETSIDRERGKALMEIAQSGNLEKFVPFHHLLQSINNESPTKRGGVV